MKKLNKLMASILALCLCLSLLPMAVFAEDVPQTPADIISGAENNGKDAEGKFDEATGDYTTADGNYESANNHSGSAIKDAAEVTDGMNKITSDLKDKVEEQQGAVNDAEEAAGKAVDKITSDYADKVKDTDKLTSDANTQTGVAQDAIDEANRLLSRPDVSASDKRDAAAKAVEEAQEAVKKAGDAQQAVIDTENARLEAQAALDAAKAEYEAAVLAAQNAVGAAKDEAQAKVDALKVTFENAKTAYETAEEFKKAADESWAKAEDEYAKAQELLKNAEEVYTKFVAEWDEKYEYPMNDVDSKLQNAVDAKDKLQGELDTAQGNLDNAQNAIDSNEATLKGSVKEDGTEEKGLYDQWKDAKDEQNKLDKIEEDLADKKGELKDAEDELKDVQSIQDALDHNLKYQADHANKNASASNNNHKKMPQWIHENQSKIDGLLKEYFTNPEFKATEEINNWARTNLFDDDPGADYEFDLSDESLDKFLSNAGKYFTVAVSAAQHKYETLSPAQKAVDDAKDAVKNALPEGMTEESLTKRQNELVDQLKNLDDDITRIEKEIKDQKAGLDDLQKSVNSAQDAVDQNNDAIRMLTALKDLKDRVVAAKDAIEKAEDAKAKADAAKREAEAAQKAYIDAKESVEIAEAALKVKLEASLKTGASFDDLEAYKAKLDELKGKLKEAEEKKDQAKEEADKAKEDADKALEDANKAQEDANNARDIVTDLFDLGEEEVEDTAIPLAEGPITRAQFIDYLWRHEGEPASAGECTFTDVTEEHEYFAALCWGEENGIAEAYFNAEGHEDGTFEPDELVTVAAVREFLGNFADVFGGNVVAVSGLTTLTGADDEAVLNCGEVVAEFFGEEYVSAEDEDIEIAA